MSFKLPPLQTVTQCASLVTATRAIWELTRMVRAKKREVEQTREVEDLLDEIEVFVREGVLTKREWKSFCVQVEEAISNKECSPREAQAKVLDFLEALHSIAQEYEDDDDYYVSEPDDAEDLPKPHQRRIEAKPKQESQRDSSQRRDSKPQPHAPADQPSPKLQRSQTVPLPDTRPRRVSAPTAPHQHFRNMHGHAGQASPGMVSPRGSVSSIPHMPVMLPSQQQHTQLYRQPRHSFASVGGTPTANGTFTPSQNGIFSPGHMLPTQAAYHPNAPAFFTPGTASPYAAGIAGSASPAFAYATVGGTPVGPTSPNPHAFPGVVPGTVSPPGPNYSGPLPVPASRNPSQQGWGIPTIPITVAGPTSPAVSTTIPTQNTWNTTAGAFPFPSVPPGQTRSNGNSNRPSAAPSPPYSNGNSPHHSKPASGNASPRPNASAGPTSPTTTNQPDPWPKSANGFSSPTQEAQAHRAMEAKLREQARQQSQAQAIEEELGVPDMKVPRPPNSGARKKSVQINGFHHPTAKGGATTNGVNGGGKEGAQRPESVSDAGTYMAPEGDRGKRRRRKQ